MTTAVRTPEENFAELSDFPFAPNYHSWADLRVHYLDEGPKDGPVMLLVHGMPTWSYLYRTMIPPLVAAGYRCIAPDHLGFGRSDKPTDPHWYSIARHQEVLTSLICTLDLRQITLVCQDWGGPIGLAQAMTMPERFARLVIMNTWLHHDGFEYSEAIQSWRQNWMPDGIFARERPEVALLPLLTAGLITPDIAFPALLSGTPPELTGQAAVTYRGYGAPFHGLDDVAYNGLRRFPLSIPFETGEANGAVQAHHYQELLSWPKPIHFVWGCADQIFTEQWGRSWAERLGATFDPIDTANHFLQDTDGPTIVSLVLDRIATT